MRNCSGGGGNSGTVGSSTITDTIISYDTIITEKISYIPRWKTKYITKTDTIPANIDTVAILKDYYAKYFYVDTIYIDTLGYAVINDTISRNSIISRGIKSNFLIPNKTVTNTFYINQREFYLGLGLSGKTDQINYLGGELLFKSKKHQVYGFGIGINQNFQPVLSGRMYWKIGK
jgi:hypothetical protein